MGGDRKVTEATEPAVEIPRKAHYFKTDIGWSGSHHEEHRVMLSWDVERCDCDRPWRHEYPA